MKLKFAAIFNKAKLNLWINQLITRVQPVITYWRQLNPREQQLITIGGILIGLTILIFIISAAISFKTSLENDYAKAEQYRLDAKVMAKQYNDLTQLTGNQFSQVNSDRIKGDMSQVLGVKDPSVLLANNILTISADNAKFELVMLFLDQLRKSYGLFPNTLQITRLAQSGYVSFSATFKVDQ